MPSKKKEIKTGTLTVLDVNIKDWTRRAEGEPYYSFELICILCRILDTHCASFPVDWPAEQDCSNIPYLRWRNHKRNCSACSAKTGCCPEGQRLAQAELRFLTELREQCVIKEEEK